MHKLDDDDDDENAAQATADSVLEEVECDSDVNFYKFCSYERGLYVGTETIKMRKSLTENKLKKNYW